LGDIVNLDFKIGIKDLE